MNEINLKYVHKWNENQAEVGKCPPCGKLTSIPV